jgi:hypothetical protein
MKDFMAVKDLTSPVLEVDRYQPGRASGGDFIETRTTEQCANYNGKTVSTETR